MRNRVKIGRLSNNINGNRGDGNDDGDDDDNSNEENGNVDDDDGLVNNSCEKAEIITRCTLWFLS